MGMFQLYSIQSKLFMVFLTAILIIGGGGCLSLYFSRQQLSATKLFVETTLPRIESSGALQTTALQISKIIFSITRTTQSQTLKSDFIECSNLLDRLEHLTSEISQKDDGTDILSLNLTSQSIRDQAQLVLQLQIQRMVLLEKEQLMLQKAKLDALTLPSLIMADNLQPVQPTQKYQLLQKQIIKMITLLNRLEMAKTPLELESLESAYKQNLASIFIQPFSKSLPLPSLPSSSFPRKHQKDLEQLLKLQRQNINISNNINNFIVELDRQVSLLNSLTSTNVDLVFNHFNKSAEHVIQRQKQTFYLISLLMLFAIGLFYALYKRIVTHGFSDRLGLISLAMASDPVTTDDRNLPLAGKDEIADMARALNILLDKAVQLNHLATSDDLTKIYNRRRFFELAANERNRSERKKSETVFLMLDLDHFKSINDTYGHSFGDTVLYETAQICQSVIRTIDILGRYGGEEFAMLLPETNLTEGMMVAERIRQAIESKYFTTNTGLKVKVTMSLGLVVVDLGEITVDQALDMADNALYKAKEKGRNTVATCHAYQKNYQ